MAVRITCINKDGGNHQNAHEGITHFGWLNEEVTEGESKSGKCTKSAMIKFLKEDGGKAYVKDSNGNKTYCVVVTADRDGKTIEYVRTKKDDTLTNNLLSLIECR